MVSAILLIVFASLLQPASVSGTESYSCRDASGHLYFTDSPEKLPDECQSRETFDQESLDKLNIVPAAPSEPGVGFAPGEETRSEKYEERRQQVEQLQQRAEELVNTFQQARNNKRAALRRWSYQSREEIKKADQLLEQVREAKQQLLSEVEKAWMLTGDREQVRRTLGEITDE